MMKEPMSLSDKSSVQDIQSLCKNGLGKRKRTVMKIFLYAFGLCISAIAGYMVAERCARGDTPCKPPKATVQTSSTLAFNQSRILLPNEWSIVIGGKNNRLVLNQITNIRSNEDDCNVALSGNVMIGEEIWPISVHVALEPITSNEFFVSKICSFSVERNKAVETELLPFIRLYCGHLQKSLLKK